MRLCEFPDLVLAVEHLQPVQVEWGRGGEWPGGWGGGGFDVREGEDPKEHGGKPQGVEGGRGEGGRRGEGAGEEGGGKSVVVGWEGGKVGGCLGGHEVVVGVDEGQERVH